MSRQRQQFEASSFQAVGCGGGNEVFDVYWGGFAVFLHGWFGDTEAEVRRIEGDTSIIAKTPVFNGLSSTSTSKWRDGRRVFLWSVV